MTSSSTRRNAGEIVPRLLLALGAVLVVSGSILALRQSGSPTTASTYPAIMLASLLTVLGGSILGSVVGNMISRLSQESAVDEIKQLIKANTSRAFFSAEEDLRPIRRAWHQYHLTVFDGKPIWRHRICHFESSGGLGTLGAEFEVMDPVGSPHKYSLEAGVRGGRLVLLQRRLEGHEEAIVSVYPDMLAGHRSVHCGVTFLQDWDSNHLVTRTILSRDPLIAGISEGTVPDDVASTLNDRWDSDFGRLNRVMFAPTGAE